MVFNSISFAIFFPFAVLIYFMIPADKGVFRKIWLLICSYYFYICQGAVYALLLLAVTLVTYGAALLMGKGGSLPESKFAQSSGEENRFRNKWIMAVALIFCFAFLFYYKYFDFFCRTFNISTGLNIILPVGISYYIFKSASYIIDVYRGVCAPERDFVKYALYVSFFPEILAGPISRAPEVMPQFDEIHEFDYDRIRKGLLRMLYGYFLKLVIASRLAIPVDLFYNSVRESGAIELLIVSFLFPVQIYCDFMSYSEIAIGAGEVMGITLSENFRQPFLAKDLSELWRRWHMSLTNWFRDYLYIPLGGSRKGIIRKYINIIIVFTMSGLWHGAAFTYIFWGFLTGLFQCISSITKEARIRAGASFPVQNTFTRLLHGVYMRVMTYILFSFTAIFFRAATLDEAFTVIKKIFTGINPDTIMAFDPRTMGLGTLNLLISVMLIIILLIADIMREKKGDVFAWICSEKWYLRWGVYYFLTLAIILSSNIGAAKFIYYAF